MENQNSKIHRRFKQFVEFISPEKDKIDEIKKQADEIRKCIKKKAEEDGKIVAEMPYSGSFGKETGIRRYYRGDAEVEGMDIDIGFILEKKDKDGDELTTSQICNFEKYATACYPDSKIDHTKSSATIYFESTKRQYDLVPLIKTGKEDIQKLIRTNIFCLSTEERQSSVKKHKEFIKSRNKSSNDLPGVVHFNQCLRLLKWWKYHQQSNSSIFGNNDGDEKVPSFLLDLLSAYAYDELSVSRTYPETLAYWFSRLATVARNRQKIVFTDFQKNPQLPESYLWLVADPVEATNNAVKKDWDNCHIDELADWFENARDLMATAIRKDSEGDHCGSLDCLVELFGNAFKNNVEKS